MSNIIKIENNSSICNMSPNNLPIQHINCNEWIELDTPEPSITKEIVERINSGLLQPQRILFVTGPLYINGVFRGDVIKITIHSIQMKKKGIAWYGNWIGLLKSEITDGYLQEFEIENEHVIINNMKIKTHPMIGTIGVSPIEEISCLFSGTYGGNMDIPTLTAGSKLYLKSQVDGGLLALGDVHALMGYGEVLGTGIEVGSTVVLSVEKESRFTLDFPLHETSIAFEIIASQQSLIEAIKEVTRNAIDFIRVINNCGFSEAYIIVGELCDLKITQVVNPSYTVLMHIPKSILSIIE